MRRAGRLGASWKARAAAPGTSASRTGSSRAVAAGAGRSSTLAAAAALLLLLTLAAYLPALSAGFVWDDDSYVTENPALRSLEGLRRIWLEPGATPQYYPLVFTTFWLEHALGGLAPLGYHLDNVLLHGLAAVLLWASLRRLRLPGAWLAAALFALHPMQVESVAWITERKNVLSGCLYLASLLVYLRCAGLRRGREEQARTEAEEGRPAKGVAGPGAARAKDAGRRPGVAARTEARVAREASGGESAASPADRGIESGPRRRWLYAASLLLFLGALLSKTVTFTLPAAVLLIVWWKRGRVGRRDVLPLLPFFALGAAAGLLTAWMEVHHVGAEGAEWSLSFLERLLLAGRILWFYAGKLLWPHPLSFVYHRWEVDAGVWWQYLFPLAAVAAIALLWLLRRRLGRGPLAAVLYFAGTLLPALGFFNVYPMRYSWVADHFQYLAGIGLIALAAGAASRWIGGTVAGRPTEDDGQASRPGQKIPTGRLHDGSGPKGLQPASAAAKAGLPLPARLAAGALLVVLGLLTFQRARAFRDAETLWQDTLVRNPGAWIAQTNLANLLSRQGKYAEALPFYEESLRLRPRDAVAHNNLGLALMKLGRPAEGLARFQEARRLDPELADAQLNLGEALALLGQTEEAAACYREALRLRPGDARTHAELAPLLARLGRRAEAEQEYREALRLEPGSAATHNDLGVLLAEGGRGAEAAEEYLETLRLDPRLADARINLGNVLAGQGKLEEAEAQYREALRLAPERAEGWNNIGHVLALAGKLDEAIAAYRQALRLQPAMASARVNLGNALAARGDLPEAIELFSEVLRLDPANTDALYNLGLALARQGRFAEAAQRFTEVLRLLPGDEKARQRLEQVRALQRGGG